MLERLTCVHGHGWDAPAAGESPRCPECGAPPDPLTFAEPEPGPAPAPAPVPIRDDGGRPVVVGYEILEDRGRSPAGVRLYRAKQLAAGREVLLGVVLAREDAGQRAWNALRGEAVGHGTLSHPHIVQLYETGDRERQSFYDAMEFVDGPTLAEAVGDEPVPVAQAVALVELLARAVAYAHGRRQIHRHLEPAAVLLQRVPAPKAGPAADPGGGVCRLGEGFYVPRLRGFGLARRPVEGDVLDYDLYADAGYLSPEQSWGKGQELGPHTDVYGLGGILYYLLTGRPPFRGPTQDDLLDAIQTARLVEPSATRRTPPALEFVCRSALARRVARRYADAGALADDLRRVAGNSTPVGFRPSLRQRVGLWRKRRPGLAALAFMGVVCVVSTLIAYAAGDSGEPPVPRSKPFTDDGRVRAEINGLRDRLRVVTDWQQEEDYRRQIRGAAFFAGNDKGAARDALEECLVPDREFEWHYLDRLVSGRGKALLADTGGTTAFAFYGEDGTKMAIAKPALGRNESSIRVVDVATSGLRFAVTVPDSPVRRLAFLDGDKLAVLAGDKPGRLYLYDGQMVLGVANTVDAPSALLAGHPANAFFVGKPLTVLNGVGERRVHDADDARPLGPPQSVLAGRFEKTAPLRLELLPDGMSVAVADASGRGVYFWSANGPMNRIQGIDSPVECMASEAGGTLAVATRDKCVYFSRFGIGIGAAPDDGPLGYEGMKGGAKQMAFSRDGKRLAVAHGDGTTLLLGYVPPRPVELRANGKPDTGRWIELLTIPVSGVRGLEFAPDGNALAASGPDGVVLLGAWR